AAQGERVSSEGSVRRVDVGVHGVEAVTGPGGAPVERQVAHYLESGNREIQSVRKPEVMDTHVQRAARDTAIYLARRAMADLQAEMIGELKAAVNLPRLDSIRKSAAVRSLVIESPDGHAEVRAHILRRRGE